MRGEGRGTYYPLVILCNLKTGISSGCVLCTNTDLTFLPQFKVHHVNHLLGKPLTMPFVPGFADVWTPLDWLWPVCKSPFDPLGGTNEFVLLSLEASDWLSISSSLWTFSASTIRGKVNKSTISASDQHVTSPWDIHTLFSKQAMRILKFIR